jgi:hypothetical protein
LVASAGFRDQPAVKSLRPNISGEAAGSNADSHLELKLLPVPEDESALEYRSPLPVVS